MFINNAILLFINNRNDCQINKIVYIAEKMIVYKQQFITVYEQRKKRNCLTWSVQTEQLHTRICSSRKLKILKVATDFSDPKNR